MTLSVKSNYGNPLKRKDLSTKVSRNYRTEFLGYKRSLQQVNLKKIEKID